MYGGPKGFHDRPTSLEQSTDQGEFQSRIVSHSQAFRNRLDALCHQRGAACLAELERGRGVAVEEYLLDRELRRGLAVHERGDTVEDRAQTVGQVTAGDMDAAARHVVDMILVKIDDAVARDPGTGVDAEDANWLGGPVMGFAASPQSSSARISSEISALEYTC